jgi:hypothetical protein
MADADPAPAIPAPEPSKYLDRFGEPIHHLTTRARDQIRPENDVVARRQVLDPLAATDRHGISALDLVNVADHSDLRLNGTGGVFRIANTSMTLGSIWNVSRM